MITVRKIHAPEQLDSLAGLDLLAIEAEAAVRDSDSIETAITDLRCRFSRIESQEAIKQIDQRIAVLNALSLDEANLHALTARITDGRRSASRGEIGEHIALLLGSFPRSNAPDPVVYTRMMIEEVAAAGPSVIALDAACRSLRRSLRWLPATAEVLAAIAAETERWDHRLDCARNVVERRAEAVTKLTELCRMMSVKAVECREKLNNCLKALEAELRDVQTKGRGSGRRWRWEVQADVDRVRNKLGGS